MEKNKQSKTKRNNNNNSNTKFLQINCFAVSLAPPILSFRLLCKIVTHKSLQRDLKSFILLNVYAICNDDNWIGIWCGCAGWRVEGLFVTISLSQQQC